MPELPSVKIFKRTTNLIMRMYNSVIMIFEIAPEEFSPSFYTRYTREVHSQIYTIVDEWYSGFLQGVALASDAWQPLLDEKPGILRPFELFATPEGWRPIKFAGPPHQIRDSHEHLDHT